MLSVKGIYDGKKVEISEKVDMSEWKLQEVIVTFLDENVHLEPFDLYEFLKDWNSEEIEAIEEIYNNRKSFFDGRKFEF